MIIPVADKAAPTPARMATGHSYFDLALAYCFTGLLLSLLSTASLAFLNALECFKLVCAFERDERRPERERDCEKVCVCIYVRV